MWEDLADMKRHLFRYSAAAAAAALLLAAPFSPAVCAAEESGLSGAEETSAVRHIKVGVCGVQDGGIFRFLNADNEPDGLEVDLLKAIDEADDRIEMEFAGYQAQPGEYALLTKEDGCDLRIGFFSEESIGVTGDSLSDGPYLCSLPVYVAASDNSSIQSAEDMAGKKALVMADGPIPGNLAAYNEAHPDRPIEIEEYRGSSSDIYFFLITATNGSPKGAAICDALSASQCAADYEADLGCGLNLIPIPDAEQLDMRGAWFVFTDPEDTGLRTILQEDVALLASDGTIGEMTQKACGVDLTPVLPKDASGSDASGGGEEDSAVYSDPETIRDVQILLNEAGYDCGTADGIAGSRTNEAVMAYKADNGLNAENADITGEMLKLLGLL